MYNGYDFYFKDGSDVLTFPITPGELKMKIGSNNKVVTLISEGDINILKSPSLVEIEFTARLPMKKFPYSRNPASFQEYFDKFKELKEKKKSFRFIVSRRALAGKTSWATDFLVALEDMDIDENADEGDDVLVDFKLKQYKEYGNKILKTSSSESKTTTSTSDTSRSNDNKATTSSNYVIKSGDNLWTIAKSKYGDGALWTKIYEANKSTIESAAKSRGMASSSNGHWIFPGVQLTIPPK